MRKRASKKLILLALLALNLVLWREIFLFDNTPQEIKITFFDVGQGDAVLIEDNFNNQILIDGGNGRQIIEKLETYLPFYDKKIEAVILTHPDFDHLGGILRVLEIYQVERFIHSGLKKEAKSYQNLIKMLEEDEIPTILAQQGLALKFPNGARLQILYPEINMTHLKIEDGHNEHSIISKLIFDRFEALFLGDAGRRLEARLLRSGINLEADLIKIAHHGSRYSSHPLLLGRANPKAAVISVGQNPYGHPHPDVLKRLENLVLFRTDITGDIQAISDGASIYFYPN